jgi:hypothetical protein
MFWLSYERWDFAGFGGFWYKSGGRTTGVGGKSVNLKCKCVLPSFLTRMTSGHILASTILLSSPN